MYTADGERIAVRNHLGGTVAVWLRELGGNPLRVYLRTSTGSWSWSRDDVWVGRERVASVYASGVQYVHSDHLGSPRKVTDSLGNVVASNDFYPFGLPAATTGLQGSWFSGYELEHQNTASTYTDDLYFLHARWYFPQVARFLSPDPVRGDLSSPQSFNLFAYVGGNAINFVDPWGLAASGGPGGGSGKATLPDGRVCELREDGTYECGFLEGVTVTGQAPTSGGVPSDYFLRQQLAELFAWMALYDRAAFAGQRISSHGFVFSQSNAWANSNSPSMRAAISGSQLSATGQPNPWQWNYQGTFGCGGPGVVSLCVAVVKDRLGRQYVTVGVGVGKSLTWFVPGVYGNKARDSRSLLSAQQLQNHLTGFGISGSLGVLGGVGFSRGIGSGVLTQAEEIYMLGAQLGVQVSYGFQISP